MSKVTSTLRAFERRLAARRKATGQLFIVTSFDDGDMVTDEHGNRMTAAEFERLHPDATVIKLTWGDDDPAHDKDLTRWIPSQMWTDI